MTPHDSRHSFQILGQLEHVVIIHVLDDFKCFAFQVVHKAATCFCMLRIYISGSIQYVKNSSP